MHKKARLFVTIGFITLLICQSTFPVFAQGDDASKSASYETEVLGDGLYAFRFRLDRTYFLVSTTGVIVVDPLNGEAAAILKQEIADITMQPVKFVVYSNSMFHRSEGGQIFKDEGAEFVAHEQCAANLSATPNAQVVMPDITFEESYEISLGNQTLALHHFGPGFGTCYTTLVVRPAGVMLLPDIVMPPQASLPPDPTIANYYIHRIIPFFESIEDLAAQEGVDRVAGGTVSEGEGGVFSPVTAPVSLIARQRGFWETLLGTVKTEYDKGTPARAIPQQVDMSVFAEFAGYDERHIEIMIRRIYSLYRIGR